jgi:acyl carrier protein
MIREEIKNKLVEIIAGLLSMEEGPIDEKASFINDLNADSLDGVELVMTVEDEFNIDITDEEAENATSVKLLIDLVERKMNG